MIVGIGCDIVKIDRMMKSLDAPVMNKILTPQERELCASFSRQRKAEWIAGRFAAKEAIYKAIHTQVDTHVWLIEVLVNQDGSPCCVSFPDYLVQISIAHEKEYAIAYAMVLTKE